MRVAPISWERFGTPLGLLECWSFATHSSTREHRGNSIARSAENALGQRLAASYRPLRQRKFATLVRGAHFCSNRIRVRMDAAAAFQATNTQLHARVHVARDQVCRVRGLCLWLRRSCLSNGSTDRSRAAPHTLNQNG